MRPSLGIQYLVLGLISTVNAAPRVIPGSDSARDVDISLHARKATKGYVVTYKPAGTKKSEEEYTKIDDGIVGLINEARKKMNIPGNIEKSQVKFENYPVTVDEKFYFTFTGPLCGKDNCVARGMDFAMPTENATVLGAKGQTLYTQGTPPGPFKPIYQVTYNPAGSGDFSPTQLGPVDKGVLALIQKARDKLNIKAEVKFEQVQFTNYPASTTEGGLSFTFTGPLCGNKGGKCTARAKDLRNPTEDAIVAGAKGNVLFKSGASPEAK